MDQLALAKIVHVHHAVPADVPGKSYKHMIHTVLIANSTGTEHCVIHIVLIGVYNIGD